MGSTNSAIRTTHSDGGITLTDECKSVLNGCERIGIDWGSGKITLSKDPDFGRVTRGYHDGRVIIPVRCRGKYGEDRYYRMEAKEGEETVELYPQIVRDAKAEIVEDGI